MPTAVNPVLRRAGAVLRRERPLLDDQWRYTIRRERAWSPRMGPHEISLLFFRSSGCRFSKGGECTMCDYQIAAPMHAPEMVRNVAEALAENRSHKALFIAPLGSMFDPVEVPPAAADEILRLAGATGAKLFATETRMEFLAPGTMRRFVQPFANRPKRINIGLESTDPWMLANSVGKSIPVHELRATADLLHAYETELAANILVGSLWLTPHETINQTLRSIRCAIAAGVDLCVLFPSNVRRWTVQYWLWQRGEFRPPSLWTLVEVLLQLEEEELSKVALSYFDKKPNESIVALPQTCDCCQPAVIAALWHFAGTGRRDRLEAVCQAGCACRARWRESLTAPASSVRERALPVVEEMARELCGSRWWEANRAETIACLEMPQ